LQPPCAPPGKYQADFRGPWRAPRPQQLTVAQATNSAPLRVGQRVSLSPFPPCPGRWRSSCYLDGEPASRTFPPRRDACCCLPQPSMLLPGVSFGPSGHRELPPFFWFPHVSPPPLPRASGFLCHNNSSLLGSATQPVGALLPVKSVEGGLPPPFFDLDSF